MAINNIPFLVLLGFFIVAGASAGTQSEPEGASSSLAFVQESQQASSDDFMVVTANSHASRAARDVLAAGGTAIDAAIAAAFVLNVVEPQSSGLGGSAFLLYFDAATKQLHSYDGREEAPASAHPAMFIKEDGTAYGFKEASKMGRAFGIAGFLALLEKAHQNHGKKAWSTLVTPAIDLAQKGFALSPRLVQLLLEEGGLHERSPSSPLFQKDGTVHPIGSIYRNEALAQTLQIIRDEGSHPFYHGILRDSIIKAVRETPYAPAVLTHQDFARYDVRILSPLCRPYREHEVCSVTLPTSGGVTLIQILTMLERFSLEHEQAGSAKTIHLISEASRLAYEDRAFWLADDRFIPVPIKELLDKDYLQKRSLLIKPFQVMDKTEAGPRSLMKDKQKELCNDAIIPQERPSTTHISIIDREGNAVALTASIGPAFGSGISASGFFLNGEITDFRLRQKDNNNCFMVNDARPHKRPLSSMTPLIIFDDRGKPIFVGGSAGGIFIIAYLAQVVTAVLDQRQTPFDALLSPHHVRLHRGALFLEEDKNIPSSIIEQLQSWGTIIERRPMTSGLHVIHVDEAGIMHGAADPRREGMALGK